MSWGGGCWLRVGWGYGGDGRVGEGGDLEMFKKCECDGRERSEAAGIIRLGQ